MNLLYLIPSIFFSKYSNNVPTFIKKEYYNKYRITSSCCRYSRYEKILNKNEKLKNYRKKIKNKKVNNF